MTTTDRAGGIPVATIAGALFCVVLIFLALQVRAGRDPAIGATNQPAASRPVVVRRIVVRRIVEQQAGAGATSGGQAAVAPAPAAAPVAAAPAPAPVVSSGS